MIVGLSLVGSLSACILTFKLSVAVMKHSFFQHAWQGWHMAKIQQNPSTWGEAKIWARLHLKGKLMRFIPKARATGKIAQ